MAQRSKSSSKIVDKSPKTTHSTSIFDEYKEGDNAYERVQQLKFISAKGLNPMQVQTLVERIFEWAMKPDSVDFDEFLHQRFIFRSNFVEWEKQFPELKEARLFAEHQMGILREKGMGKRALDYQTYARNQHQYRHDWRSTRDEDHERRKVIAQNTAPADSSIKLIVETVQSCPDVPDYHKKDKE